jgi:hypothetical protein
MTNDENYSLKWAKKIICANVLGGKCTKCESNDIFTLQFHHLDKSRKKFDICANKNIPIPALFPEVKKCQLLCANCHAETEQNENGNNVSHRRRNIKKAMLDYKQIHCCNQCQYSGKNFASLDFHHRIASDKSFKVVQIACMYGMADRVCRELDKCEVLCKNCHTKLHINIKRFEQLKTKIYHKVETYKPRSKMPHKKIIEMYISGLKPAHIAKKLGFKRFPIYYVIKKYHSHG